MNKTTLRNVKASVEVREVKDELSEAKLKTVSGGKATVHDMPITKFVERGGAEDGLRRKLQNLQIYR